MDKNYKVILIGLFLLILLSLSFIYFNYSKSQADRIESDLTVNNNTATDQYSPEKLINSEKLPSPTPVTKIEIGTQGLTRGTFTKVENGEIFINSGADAQIKMPLTVDEIAVTCTTQDLKSATELDFNLVSKVSIANPGNLMTFIPENEVIVAFAQNIEGVNRVHTVALDSSKCP